MKDSSKDSSKGFSTLLGHEESFRFLARGPQKVMEITKTIGKQSKTEQTGTQKGAQNAKLLENKAFLTTEIEENHENDHFRIAGTLQKPLNSLCFAFRGHFSHSKKLQNALFS